MGRILAPPNDWNGAWGTVDDNNRFIPGKAYLFSPIEERSKLIFPENWDLSEIEKLSGNRKPGRPVIDSQDGNRLYGDIWLLERIADVTGIRKDLMKTFDGNREMTDAVMTLAMYLLCGGRNKDHLPLAQTLEAVVYTLDGHMPVYYRTFAGNTLDSRSLETILHDLE